MTPSRTRLFAALVCFSFLSAIAPAQPTARSEQEQTDYRHAMESADQKIAEEVKAHSELMKNLEYLTTQIGPRLTGSPEMNAASQWTLKRFQDYGIDAHLETTQIPHAWKRGMDTLEIIAPIQREVPIHAMGWSKATAGTVSAPVVMLTATTPEELAPYKGKLKGAIVMRKPAELNSAEDAAENAYDAVVPPQRGVPKQWEGWRQRMQVMKMIAAEKPAALLVDSGKPDSLFNMGGGYENYQPTEAPEAFLTHEDYSLIWRLAQAGAVTLKINITGTFSDTPAPTSITVAEIKGSEHPDERVIIGGHLDSWDLGQGALDNGTGAMAVLEAARTLKALGWKPKRTLTFILFTGEEQGGTGAETFVKNHNEEIPKIDAVLIHDIGTGRVFSIALEDLWETGPLMSEIYRPLQEVFDLQPLSTHNYDGSDHDQFLRAGVPGYFCVQKPAHYGQVHHSQADTFDKVIPDEINQGAAFLAAWAWNVSEMPQALPHHAPRGGSE